MREEVHKEVCEHGFDSERNTFTQSYGSRELDASLLLIPRVGFLPPDDPRVVGTIDAVRAELEREGFLLRRYSDEGVDVDGLPGGEGTFLVCSFWLAGRAAHDGPYQGRPELFERACSAWPTTWGCCPRSTTPSRAASSATSRRRSATSAWWGPPSTCSVKRIREEPRRPDRGGWGPWILD